MGILSTKMADYQPQEQKEGNQSTTHNCQRLETTQKFFSGLVHKLQYIHSVGTTQQKVPDDWQNKCLESFQSNNCVQASGLKMLYSKELYSIHTYFSFLINKVLCYPDWPPAHYIAENDLEILSFASTSSVLSW